MMFDVSSMSIMELQLLRARIDAELQYRVCGDPRSSVGASSGFYGFGHDRGPELKPGPYDKGRRT